MVIRLQNGKIVSDSIINTTMIEHWTPIIGCLLNYFSEIIEVYVKHRYCSFSLHNALDGNAARHNTTR